MAILPFVLPLTAEPVSGQTIRGILLDQTSGQGIPQGAISLSDSAGEVVSTTLTNRSGRFTIEAPGPGSCHFSAAAVGYRRGAFGPNPKPSSFR